MQGIVVVIVTISGLIMAPSIASSKDMDELLLQIEVGGTDATARMITCSAIELADDLPESWKDASLLADLRGPDGKRRVASASVVGGGLKPHRTLAIEWLEPLVEAGSRATFTAVIKPTKMASISSPFGIRQVTDGILCTEDSLPVFRLMAAYDPTDLENTKKVYHHLWDASGRTLLTKGPDGKYPHHRGLFIGWKETRVGQRKWDSWHMPNGGNTQRLSRSSQYISNGSARLVTMIDWFDPDESVYIREARSLTAYARTEAGRVLDIQCALRPAEGLAEAIHLEGDLQHAGLQFRASNEVASETESLTEFIFPAVDADPGKYLRLKHPDDSIMGKDPRWGCMLFTVEGQRFGILYMAHPKTKRPAEFSIRFYGRFGEYFPYVLRAGDELIMRYRLFVFEGERDPEYLEAVYQGYANPPEMKIVEVDRNAGDARAAYEPRTFLIDPHAIVEVKKRIAKADSEFTAPLNALKRDADEALKQEPVSVMDKETIPPSGNKHDYVSLGSYWWPNPDTPDGLPYVRRDGYGNPEGNELDRPRLRKMCSAVNTLALAYYFTGHEPYAEHAATLLRTWFLDAETKMNPHLEYAQGIPGVCEGRGIGIIDTAHSFAQLVDSIGLLEQSDAWTDADRGALQEWFRTFLNWLLESEKGKDEARQPNNHGTWYDVQAAAIALFIRVPQEARKVLEAASEKRIAAQIEPDGRQPWELRRTKSFGYSTMNLSGFLELATLGDRVGVDLWRYETEDGRGIRKALDYLLQYVDKPEKWPHKEIKGAQWGRYPMLLRRAANAYGAAQYDEMIATLPDIDSEADRFHLLYPIP